MTELLLQHEVGLREAKVVELLGTCDLVPVKYIVREVDERIGNDEPPEMLSVSIHLGSFLAR